MKSRVTISTLIFPLSSIKPGKPVSTLAYKTISSKWDLIMLLHYSHNITGVAIGCIRSDLHRCMLFTIRKRVNGVNGVIGVTFAHITFMDLFIFLFFFLFII